MSIEVEFRPAASDDLLGRAQRGEAEAFGVLVDEPHAELVRIAYVVCGDVEFAREAEQAAWIKAWEQQLQGLPDPREAPLAQSSWRLQTAQDGNQRTHAHLRPTE